MNISKKYTHHHLPIIVISSLLFVSLLANIRQATTPSLYEQPLIEKELPTSTPSTKQKTMTLMERCGDYPDEVPFSLGKFTRLTGPLWSPDCRHVAWGIWESGTAWLGDDVDVNNTGDTSRPYDIEGIFLLNDYTKKVEKIYTPQKGETPEILEWQGSNEIVFTIDGGHTNSTVELNQ